jgi:hypothetical protein
LTIQAVKNELKVVGWIRLPYRFDETALCSLTALGPHRRLGQRLLDMSELSKVLPGGFKNVVTRFGFNPIPLRAVGFVKTPDANWSLPWHQDRVIACTERTDDPNLKNWTYKSGIWHCEPPVGVLRKMAFAYISFDDIESGAGGLEIAEGTHLHGKIKRSHILERVKPSNISRPDMQRGEVLLVSALTLHRSSALSSMLTRRALRLDFSKAH